MSLGFQTYSVRGWKSDVVFYFSFWKNYYMWAYGEIVSVQADIIHQNTKFNQSVNSLKLDFFTDNFFVFYSY